MSVLRLSNVVNRRLWLLLVGLITVGAPPVDGQESKFKGRLPAHYGDIVTEAQRQQIYEIQGKYAKQIDALEEQLEALKDKQEAEIAKVLNAEQKTKLKKAQEDAATKRKKTAEKKVMDAQKAK